MYWLSRQETFVFCLIFPACGKPHLSDASGSSKTASGLIFTLFLKTCLVFLIYDILVVSWLRFTGEISSIVHNPQFQLSKGEQV